LGGGDVRFKVQCDGANCVPQDIYYIASMDVTFSDPWGTPHDWNAWLTNSIRFATSVDRGRSGKCGENVASGNCHFEIAGVIPAEFFSQNPQDWSNHYFTIQAYVSSPLSWVDYNIHAVVQVSLDPSLLNLSIPSESVNCKGGYYCAATGFAADPINTRTGALNYAVNALEIPSSAGPFGFESTYVSSYASKFTAPLGYGWVHNQDMLLIFPAANEAGFVHFKDQSGNLYRFWDTGIGRYVAYAGYTGNLVRNSGTPTTYTLTDQAQNIYTFNAAGRITSLVNPTGQAFTYTYNSNDQLERVSAGDGTRYLDFTYNTDGQLNAVTDHTGRSVSFGYDTNGDLVTYTDVLNQMWRYEYQNHLLTRVVDPNNQTVQRNEYYPDGRAWKQFDGEDNLVVELIYNPDGTTTIKDGLDNVKTHTYDERGTLVNDTDQVDNTKTQVFDANFRPIAITNDANHTLTMTWSADGANLLSKTDPAGNHTSYTYDSLNNLTSVTDPRGFTTTYTYNGKLLTSNINALGGVTAYTYTPEGWLESVTDTAGRVTSYTYDSLGQRISMTDPSGNTWTYAYDSLGRLVDTTDPRGRVTHNEYNAAGKLLRVTQNYDPARPQNDQNLYNIVTEYEYDVRGNQIAVTDTYGRTTQYVYDNANRLIQTIDPAGNITTNTYDTAGRLVATTDPLGRMTTYEYDAAGRLLKTINPLGFHSGTTTFNVTNNTSTVTDILGRQTVFHYDELGRVIKVVDPLGNFTTTTYDPNGNVATRTDQLGRTTSYEYDALNRLIRTIDPNGGVTQTVYDASGNRTATIDPLGNETTYTYDSVGRLIATTDPLGRVTQTEYDSFGRRAATIDAAGRRTTYTYDLLDRVVAVTDPAGNTTYTTYDALGNVLTRTDANGNTTTTTYDVLNRPRVVTNANGHSTTNTYDAAGNLTAVTDALGNTTTYTYDALNRRIAVTDPLGNTTQSSYDSLGNLLETTDANGVVTRYEYDALNRQTAVILNYKPGVQADAETNVRYEFAYNAVGNRVSVTDPNGNVTVYGYDALNRVVQKTDPLANTWSYTYDLAGNRLSVTDAKGQTIQYAYDAAGQLTAINYPGSEPDVTFAYDLTGQRVSMTDGLGTTTWTYDTLNRPTSVTDAFGNTITYGYDAVGNRTSITYPDGKTVAYAYDDVNRLTNVTDWEDQNTGYDYDDAGRLSSVSLPNGVVSHYTYDNAGRLTALQHNLGASPLAAYNYTYDPAGNLMQAIENILLPSAPPTLTPTVTETATATATQTNTPTATQTVTETATPTQTATQTLTPTQTATATQTATPTQTATLTATASHIPTATQTPSGGFPDTGVLDGFNRADGPLGSDWSGDVSQSSISSAQLLPGSYIFWGNESFGADQEVYVTFVEVDEDGWEQDLLLKSQSNTTWGDGVLEVLYDANSDLAQVWTWEWPGDWVQHGADIPVTIHNGDTFGARALADGTVEVYKNGELLATRDVTSWSYYDQGGYIGLWFIGAEDAILDDFGGGTIPGGEGSMGMMMEGSGDLSVQSESIEINPALESTADSFNVELSGVDTFWQGIPLDSTQEAKVTFAQLNKTTVRSKPRSNGIWGEGTIQVMYDVPNGRIQMLRYDPLKGWVQQGEDVPVKFADGDVFSVIPRKDGTIEIYRNGKRLAKREIAVSAPVLVRENGAFQLTSYRPSNSELSIPNLALSNVEGLPPLLPLPNLPLQQTTSLTIDYTYDPLHRLTSATYSDGRSFGYTYDPAGNVLQLEQNLGPGTVTTTYTYNAANELVTAQKDGTTWNYTYDANGSLTQVLPNGNPGSGAKRYTYNVTGNLVQVEAHNGSNWDVQAEMAYNGLGQRLSMDAAGVIAHYVMDGDRPLTAESTGNTTYFLYGRGPIGEKTSTWNFALPDGLNTLRQLTDIQGDVTLSTRYTPWGGTLDTHGTGNFTYGYLGGILDVTTNLIYVGNGQYYDPTTGRFLTRGVNPDSTNPYVPWNPTGAIIAPLALFSLIARRKKGKANPYLLMLVILVVLPMSVAMACDEGTPASEPTPVEQPPVVVTPGPGNDSGGVVSTPEPSSTPLAVPCPTPSLTPMVTKTIFFGGSDGVSLANPGPDPTLQTPVWVQGATQVVPYPGGSKANQANQVDINTYKDVNLIVIGYSAGGDAALMFAEKYRIQQFQNNGTGKITDIAVLGGTMSGLMTDGRNLAQEWPSVLSGLLVWGTDIYILDDKAAGGGEANGYQPPANATGTFYFVQRLEQEHWDGGLGGQLGIGTNNSEAFKTEVISWFNSY
jgi:YD repeat-containing protein